MLRRHTRGVGHLAFLPDGRLVSGGTDGRIVLWDMEAGSDQVLLHRHGGRVHALMATAGGDLVASTAMNRLLLRRAGEEDWTSLTLRMNCHPCLAGSPNGRWVALGSYANVWLLDLDAAGAAPREVAAGVAAGSLAFSADGKLFIQDVTRGLLSLDLASGQPVEVRALSHGIYDYDDIAIYDYADYWYELGLDYYPTSRPMVCSPDGQWLAVDGHWDDWAGAHLGHLPTGRWRPLRQDSQQGGLAALAFTADGLLAVARHDGAVALWNPAGPKLLGVVTRLPVIGPHFTTRAFSADADLLADAEADGSIVVWPWRRLLEGK
jgi:WD40 repeat protein